MIKNHWRLQSGDWRINCSAVFQFLLFKPQYLHGKWKRPVLPVILIRAPCIEYCTSFEPRQNGEVTGNLEAWAGKLSASSCNLSCWELNEIRGWRNRTGFWWLSWMLQRLLRPESPDKGCWGDCTEKASLATGSAFHGVPHVARISKRIQSGGYENWTVLFLFHETGSKLQSYDLLTKISRKIITITNRKVLLIHCNHFFYCLNSFPPYSDGQQTKVSHWHCL